MIHITLGSAHVSQSTRSMVGDEAIGILTHLVQRGGVLPAPFSAFRVEVGHAPGGATFSIHRGRDILVMCGVAWTPDAAQQVWDALEGIYYTLTDKVPDLGTVAPTMPDDPPWLGVVVMPGTAMCAREDIGWLGDFERRFAWSIMEVRRK